MIAQLGRFISAAIVLIAANAVSLPAYAHSGHDVHAREHLVSSGVGYKAFSIISVVAAAIKSSQEFPDIEAAYTTERPQRDACQGKCCDAMGPGCCGAVTIAFSLNTDSRCPLCWLLHGLSDLVRDSFKAEALPEPPRSFG